MLHRSVRHLSGFARLLCGDDIARMMSTTAECEQVVRSFRTLSQTAPLPVPMAVAVAAAHLRAGEVREAVAMVAAYHRPQELVGGLVESIERNPQDYRSDSLMRVPELLHASSAPGVVPFLVLLAQYSVGQEATQPGLKATVRERIQKHIRFFPSSAASLLRPLCLVSTTERADREGILEAIRIAMRGGFVDPADFSAVLQVFLRAKDYHHIMTLWSWMRHTSACWDQQAASAAICAAAERQHLDDAVATIQCLAEAGVDPTVRAQQTFTRFLGSRSPPLATYAEQLVGHWYGEAAEDGARATAAASEGAGIPSPTAAEAPLPSASLWTGEAQKVAVELLFVHHHARNHARVRALLRHACTLWSGSACGAEEAARFMKQSGVPALVRHLSDDIVGDSVMWATFFDVPKRMDELAAWPTIAGAFATLGWRAGKMEEVYTVLRKIGPAMTSADAGVFMRVMADVHQYGSPPREVLEEMEKLASVMEKSVPAEIEGWLQLLGEQQHQRQE